MINNYLPDDIHQNFSDYDKRYIFNIDLDNLTDEDKKLIARMIKLFQFHNIFDIEFQEEIWIDSNIKEELEKHLLNITEEE